MNRPHGRTSPMVTGTAALWLALLGPGLLVAQAPTAQQQLGASAGIEQKLGAQVPLELTFNDEQGNRVRLGDLVDDRPVLLNLVYFQCPMLCNMSMDGMIRSLRALQFTAGEEFTVITVSFDPREGPKLAAAAKRTALTRYGREVDAHWHFLTGEADQIKQLADAVGFHFQFNEDNGQYVHAAGLIVLTPAGVVSRYLLGVEYAPRDLRLSLVEAADNKIGSISDQMLLLCYQYDPARGKYGLLIQNVLRIAGIATVLLMAGGIGLLLVRERRKRQAETQNNLLSPGES
jgi:protein SCO1